MTSPTPTPAREAEACDHCSKQFDPELMTHNEDGSWCPECVARWNPPTDPAKQEEPTQ